MIELIKEFYDNADPILSSIATAFGAYWAFKLFSTLNQQEYIIVVALAALVYVVLVGRDND